MNEVACFSVAYSEKTQRKATQCNATAYVPFCIFSVKWPVKFALCLILLIAPNGHATECDGKACKSQ